MAMSGNRFDEHEIVNVLSGVVALCDVTLAQLGNRARTRVPLTMIRRSLRKLLEIEALEPALEKLPLTDQIALVVDRDPLSLLTLEHELRGFGLLVAGAQSPEAARRLVDRLGDRIALVVWSLYGESVASVLARLPDDPPVIFLSDVPLASVDALERPVSAAALRLAVADALFDEEEEATLRPSPREWSSSHT